MNTRRDALKLMAAGLGSCVLPSIGLSQTTTRSNIMGVDQRGGILHYVVRTPTIGAQAYCDFEHLPILMDQYKIDRCVIDNTPFGLETLVFARQFPDRVTLCQWVKPRTVKAHHEAFAVTSKAAHIPGKLFLERASRDSFQIAYAVKKAWDRGLRKNRRYDAMLYLRIAQFIQIRQHNVHSP